VPSRQFFSLSATSTASKKKDKERFQKELSEFYEDVEAKRKELEDLEQAQILEL